MRLLLLLLIAGCAEPVHPDGYDSPTAHGLELTLQTQDCRTCHGDELDGGSSEVDCDSCHPADWRTDCIFCHGGEDSDDGAPPRFLDGSSDPFASTFPVHAAHIEGELHGPYACTECHVEPEHVLSAGHAFDDTPGRAEVDFRGGISPDAVWYEEGCSINYCHGSGIELADQPLSDEPVECGDCHPVGGDPMPVLATLSGEHREHLFHNVDCEECHPTTGDGTDIVQVDGHVDGVPTVEMIPEIAYENGRCTGRCHDENHSNAGW